jgi:ABC-type multidrug transport system permease subunit
MIKILIYNDLLRSVKDKKAMLLSFLLPIVLISLFALGYGGGGGGGSDKVQSMVFCDEDSTALSMQLQKALELKKGLKLICRQREAGKKLVLDGDVPSLFIIGKGFADSVASGGKKPMEFFYDESREMEMGLTQSAVMSTVMPFVGQQGSKGQIHKFLDEKYGDEMPQEMLDEIQHDIDGEFNSGNLDMIGSGSSLIAKALSVKAGMPWGIIQAFAGTTVMMLLFSMTSLGSSIIREQESGTLKRLLYSPVKPWQIIAAKLGSGFVFSLIQMMILVLFTWGAFSLDVFRNFGGLLLISLGTVFAATGFGVFIASIARSQKQVESISLITILVMSALGGSMIPLFLFPPLLKTVAMFTINYWAIDGFYDVLGRDVGVMANLSNFAMLLLFGMVTSAIAIAIFTRRLKNDL